MTEVEAVALWIGLLSGVVSIVLAVVAIIFAVLVDQRGRDVSTQTIRSLQKIESTVEQLSNDTRQLIKAGWDRMLGAVGQSSERISDVGAKEVAAGIAAELRSELATLTNQRQTSEDGVDERRRIDEILEVVEKSISAQLRHPPDRLSRVLDRLIQILPELSPEANALVRALRPLHLTRSEYQRLRESRLSEALAELREEGVLVPVVTASDDAAYHFPPSVARVIGAALELSPAPSDNVSMMVGEELGKVGYSIPGQTSPPQRPRGRKRLT